MKSQHEVIPACDECCEPNEPNEVQDEKRQEGQKQVIVKDDGRILHGMQKKMHKPVELSGQGRILPAQVTTAREPR